MIDKNRFLPHFPPYPFAESPVFQQQIHDRRVSGWEAGEDWDSIALALSEITAQWETRLSAPPAPVCAT